MSSDLISYTPPKWTIRLDGEIIFGCDNAKDCYDRAEEYYRTVNKGVVIQVIRHVYHYSEYLQDVMLCNYSDYAIAGVRDFYRPKLLEEIQLERLKEFYGTLG